MEARHLNPAPASRPATRRIKQVAFTLNAPQANAAAVAGTFNNWDPKRTPMRKDASGNWRTTVALAPGRYEYRFVTDGQWHSDPKCQECVENAFGSSNSVLTV